MRNRLKRILSGLLVLCLLIGSNTLTAFAGDIDITPGTGSSGGGGSLKPSQDDDGILRRPVVLVSLDTVENTGTNTGDSGYSDLAVSTVDSYLYKMPEKFQSRNAANTSALIRLLSRTGANNSSNYRYVVEGIASTSTFQNAYNTHKDSEKKHHETFTLHGVSDLIKKNGQEEIFIEGQLDLKTVKEYANQNAAKIDQSIQEFVYCWDYAEEAAACMTSIFYGYDDRLGQRLRYLDFLVMINKMTGNTNWDVVDNYLRTLNADESDKFSIVIFASGVHCDEAGSTRLIYTTQSYYSTVTKNAMADYVSLSPNEKRPAIEEVKLNIPSYDADPAGYTATLYNLFNNVSGNKCKTEYLRYWNANRNLQFWTKAQTSIGGFDNYKAATICMPTNLEGEKTGGTGYTYFSDAMANMTSKLPRKAVFNITASSDKKIVREPGENVQANVNISLQQEPNNINGIFVSLGDSSSYTITANVNLTPKGSKESSKLLDALVSPAGGKVTNNKSKSVTIKKTGLSKKELTQYFEGKKNIEFIDSGIFINDKTEFKYSASVTITGTNAVQFYAKGKEIESEYVGYDTVKWSYLKNGNGAGMYYSGLQTPYVEIKEGAPGSETFEAMAGVPTTENLYAGFGAQEFMLNMDVEEKQSRGDRVYNFTYTCTNCTEQNEKCSYSCPGHTVSVPAHTVREASGSPGAPDYDPGETCPGATATGNCSGGTITLTANCGHAGGIASQTFSPLEPCSWNDGTQGCQHNDKTNQAHPHTHVFTGSVSQHIADFDYMDIIGLELWQLNKCELKGNSDLFSNYNLSVDPNTGYDAFFTQEGYANNNGRLVFSYTLDDGNRFGNTASSATNGDLMLQTECDAAATKWMNDILSSARVKATVISDYMILGTTMGYQNAAYHQYDSAEVPVASARFATGADNKSITGDTITFNPVPWENFWTDNPNSAAKWGAHHIARSGYNGKYWTPTTKYNNSVAASGSNASEWLHDPQNAIRNQQNVLRDGSAGISGDGTQNQRMTIKGINVIDSTDTVTKAWDPNDGVDPVLNGVHDTGKCYVYAPKVISYKETSGENWSNNGNSYVTEVGYTDGQSEVNDIVIHNPVSVQAATVVANDKVYDQRTATSLAEGTDSLVEEVQACPGDETCQFQALSCTEAPTVHVDSCYQTVESAESCTGILNTHTHTDACYVNGALQCVGGLNDHAHTSACSVKNEKVLICENPHHYAPGQPWDYNDAKNHYEYGDARCWSPCYNDAKHNHSTTITTPGGQVIPTNDIFINLDRSFKIYYPDRGDFAQSPSLWGLGACTDVRGMGYTDNMDTSKWSRNKFVTFPVNVLDDNGKAYPAGTPIDLNKVPGSGGYYNFYCVLGNQEHINAEVQFNNIATNADEMDWICTNMQDTNRERSKANYNAEHNAYKKQQIDVVGYIGTLTIEDTGDFRFAQLFKQTDTTGQWLIDGLVAAVNEKLPNKIASDPKDVRQEVASPATKWHGTYGVTTQQTGGKAFDYVKLPLTPYDNNVPNLRNEPMRPGYELFMDVETVGNYYGETRTDDGFIVDRDLVYKMQITPRYWALDLDTKQYYPVDVYMGENNDYAPVVYFDNDAQESEYLYYLDWANEAMRRNYTDLEKDISTAITDYMSVKDDPGMYSRLPSAAPHLIGTASKLFLNDRDRTFIGSESTYGVNKNPGGVFGNELFFKQSQRWHFTIGLPSSSVFVKAGKPCTTENIREIENMNAVILCTLDILVRGSVWTLEYDGTGINYSDGSGFKITEDGETYNPPIDPETGKPVTDPIVVVYDNVDTSADDLRTEGSH